MKPIKNRSRRRSQAEWSMLMAQFECSGLSQEQFCRQEGIALSTFYAWRNKLRESPPATNAFIELSPPATVPDWDMELDLGRGVVLRLRGH